MFFPDNRQRIWLYTQPTDMRKSFNGLTGIIHGQLNANAQSGDWFVFVNRRKTHIKVLYFDGSGFCKRLGIYRIDPIVSDLPFLNSAAANLSMPAPI